MLNDVELSASPKNMDRWLGDGGMPLIAHLGASFGTYGLFDSEQILGLAAGSWIPTAMACNPHGIVQAGAHATVLDAAMNFALNASLPGKDRTKATLQMSLETMVALRLGDKATFEGRAVRLAHRVGWASAAVWLEDGTLVSTASATFALQRAAQNSAPKNE
jgi:acyl-coenzyme A thioesterase PaaI-like protein